MDSSRGKTQKLAHKYSPCIRERFLGLSAMYLAVGWLLAMSRGGQATCHSLSKELAWVCLHSGGLALIEK